MHACFFKEMPDSGVPALASRDYWLSKLIERACHTLPVLAGESRIGITIQEAANERNETAREALVD